MELHDIIDPDNRPPGCRPLAAAIGINGHICRQERLQLLHVAVAGRRKERRCELKAAFLGHMKARALRPDVGARPAANLAALRRLPTYRLGAPLEPHPSSFVAKKT